MLLETAPQQRYYDDEPEDGRKIILASVLKRVKLRAIREDRRGGHPMDFAAEDLRDAFHFCQRRG